MFKLVIQDDEGKTTVVPLIRDEITIGRKEGNTIRLTERNVSRRHARILRNNGEVHIEDLGSYNGIRVNNARIAERVSLRVSDQVQIGDYKLYLKAEGVEQVDDARTMPIERIDTEHTTTDVIQIPTNGATAPMPIPVPPAGPSMAGLAPNTQLVGNPNRTLVAIADTDPQGRPVASAATVAALTQPVGYGKLVVLSSNFAGKEFELSRPQMIIGRTDENDIVVNHRSISRNHAKLVRETDTGRYTISDLQSSNGVRVNGQDYGKVELRRGDVIDLGHVRLRFVEPGEDFIFARDAVITDVPDVGGKKGLLVAIILGVVVLGAVGAFFVLRNETDKKHPISGSGATDRTGSQAVIVATDTIADATVEVVESPEKLDAGVGSGTQVVQENEAQRLAFECKSFRSNEKWTDLDACARKLAGLDERAGDEYLKRAQSELKAEAANWKIDDALKNNEFIAARAELAKITAIGKTLKDGSVYSQRANDKVTSAEADFVAKQAKPLRDAKDADKRCIAYERMLKAIENGQGKVVAQKLRGDVKCAPTEIVVAVKEPIKEPIKDPPPVACDAEDLKNKGTAAIGSASWSSAVSYFEAAYKCKPEARSLSMAFMAACKGRMLAKAKSLYPRVPPGQAQQCLSNGIDPTK